MKNSKNIYVYIFLAVAILLRIDCEIEYLDYYEDKSLQISATYNFLEGHGISKDVISFNDLSEITYKPLTDWPPGYTLMLGVLLQIFDDLLLSTVILDILFILLFFYALHGLAKIVDMDRRGYLIMLVFYSLTYALFYFANSTDLIALAIFQYAIYIALKYGINKNGIGVSILLGILCLAPALIKYAYQPLAAIVPVSFIILGKLYQRKSLVLTGIGTGVVAVSGLILLFALNKFSLVGDALIEDKFGFYWENLLQFTPFPIDSFFFLEALISHYDTAFPGIFTLFNILRFALSILLIAFSIYLLIKSLKSDSKSDGKIQHIAFYLIGIFTLFALVGMLSYLSVTRAPNEFEIPAWTYVSESRYFSPAIAFLHLCVFSMLYKLDNKYFARASMLFIFASITLSLFYFSKIKLNKYVFHRSDYSYTEIHKDQLTVCKMIKEIQTSDPTKIIYTEPKSHLVNMVKDITNIHGGINNYDELLIADLQSEYPVTLILMMPFQLSEKEKSFIDKYQVEKIADLKNHALFKATIQ